MNVFIAPNGFSDHHMVLLDNLLEKKTLKENYYWVFNFNYFKTVHSVKFLKLFGRAGN